jgi:hypothetical protein
MHRGPDADAYSDPDYSDPDADSDSERHNE